MKRFRFRFKFQVSSGLAGPALSLESGLSPEAAERKWQLDFNRLEKEQRDSNDLDGQDAGKVAWQNRAHGHGPWTSSSIVRLAIWLLQKNNIDQSDQISFITSSIHCHSLFSMVQLSNCPTVQRVQPVFFRIAPVCSCEVIQFKCFFCKLMPLCCTVLLCRTQLTQRLRLNSLMVSNSHNDRM